VDVSSIPKNFMLMTFINYSNSFGYVTGYAGSKVVENYQAGSGPFETTTFYNTYGNTDTSLMQINMRGNWKMIFKPLSYITTFNNSITINESGVLKLSQSGGILGANYTDDTFFYITGYSCSGRIADNLNSGTGPYNGQEIMDSDVCYLEVNIKAPITLTINR